MKAMLFSAGLGTRLKEITREIPKALVEINGQTLLQRNLNYLAQWGVDEVIINVHHFADKIEAHLNEIELPIKTSISDERLTLLETGGGLKKATHFFSGETQPIILMNVDILTNLKLKDMLMMHEVKNPLATLAVLHRDTSRYLLFDEKMKLSGWENTATGEVKQTRGFGNILVPYAFSGVHIISPQLLNMLNEWPDKFSLTDLYLELSEDHKIMGFLHDGDKWVDVGKPESLEKAAALFE